MRITINISGRHYDRASSAPAVVDLPTGATIDDALTAIKTDPPGIRELMPIALIALSGWHIGTVANHHSRALREGDELLIFAPVAGG